MNFQAISSHVCLQHTSWSHTLCLVYSKFTILYCSFWASDNMQWFRLTQYGLICNPTLRSMHSDLQLGSLLVLTSLFNLILIPYVSMSTTRPTQATNCIQHWTISASLISLSWVLGIQQDSFGILQWPVPIRALGKASHVTTKPFSERKTFSSFVTLSVNTPAVSIGKVLLLWWGIINPQHMPAGKMSRVSNLSICTQLLGPYCKWCISSDCSKINRHYGLYILNRNIYWIRQSVK